MSSSDARQFVAELFETAVLPPTDATASAWALDEFQADDLFGAVALDERTLSVEPADAAPSIDPALLAQVEADAYARGYAEGDRAGFVRGESTAQQALVTPLTTLQAIAAQLSAAEQRWLSTLEENVAALAVAVAQHVIAREVSADPSTVLPLVQQAIAAFPLDQPLTVRVHPEDVPVVQDAMSSDSILREIRVAADPAVMRGGALVDGRERIVDGRVDTALERIFRAISQVQPS
jgi:flagellar biosynthesis/type III secretory pathway protein FliH